MADKTKNVNGQEYNISFAELTLAKINGNNERNGYKIISKHSSNDEIYNGYLE